LNIVPIVAIDYSLANLTFDENNLCLHSLKPGSPNNYIDVLKSVATAFKIFSKLNMGYAIGAGTFAKEGQSCDVLSLTADSLTPFISNEDPETLI